MDVESVTSTGLAYEEVGFAFNEWFTWTINTTTLVVDWENPTTLQIFNNETVFPTEYNVLQVEITDADPTWAVYVIQDLSGIGLSHPIHMHGHDFWVIAQDTGMFDINTTPLTLTNPPRRDVATLPGNGYLAMAYKKDNPGSWLLHCHIAWHASQGLSMQFVESQADIAVEMTDVDVFTQTCNNWVTFEETNLYEQDDSGI